MSTGSADTSDTWNLGRMSKMYRLGMLSMKMFDSRSEQDIMRLAMNSVSELGSCRAEVGYLVRDDALSSILPDGRAPDASLDATVSALRGLDGPVSLASAGWGRAFALRRLGGHNGYLVMAAESEPAGDEMFLLKVLAQQTAAALVNVSQHRREQELARQLRKVNEDKAAVNARLAATMAELEQQRSIHDVLTRVTAAGDGEPGIASALHELTGLPVAVEDRFGNPRAWAGPGRPDPYPKQDPRRREELLQNAIRHGGPVRDRDRLIALVQPRSEVFGVLALVDPRRTAGPRETYALERSATVLALELSHQHNLAEMQLRLRGDLIEDLITGTDDESAYLHSAAFGHDLHGTHHVAVAHWRAGKGDEAFLNAVTRATVQLDLKVLVARHAEQVILIIRGKPPAARLYRAIASEARSPAGAIGVGGRCESPADFPRSFAEAMRALEIRKSSRSPHGATSFEELGVFRILHGGEGEAEIRIFVQEWLGALLDYDTRRRTGLVPTLSQYLECGGNYDETARGLLIHRSTLRYRLQRIREITGFDLADVDSRLNLHVATRAWKVLEGTRIP